MNFNSSSIHEFISDRWKANVDDKNSVNRGETFKPLIGDFVTIKYAIKRSRDQVKPFKIQRYFTIQEQRIIRLLGS